MKTYMRVEGSIAMELIPPMVYDAEHPDWVEGQPTRTGLEVPIEERYPPDLVANMHDVSGMDPMPASGWTYIDGVFAPPVPYQPSPEDILLMNQTYQGQLKDVASRAMTPYVLSLNLGNATNEETLNAKAWQAYYRALQAVDISVTSPDWPATPA